MICACVHARTHTHTHTHAHTHTHTHTLSLSLSLSLSHSLTHARTHARTRARTHTLIAALGRGLLTKAGARLVSRVAASLLFGAGMQQVSLSTHTKALSLSRAPLTVAHAFLHLRDLSRALSHAHTLGLQSSLRSRSTFVFLALALCTHTKRTRTYSLVFPPPLTLLVSGGAPGIDCAYVG